MRATVLKVRFSSSRPACRQAGVLYHNWMLSSIAKRFDAPTNSLYSLREEFRAKGQSIIDLVSGNVNSQGIVFPSTILKKALSEGIVKANQYKPDPLGQRVARLAISRYYDAEGLQVPPEQILITPGTSISYLYAFKVLADPGAEILCPVPCYPLFDAIAAMSDITLKPYRLRENARWEIDFEDMEAAITSRTRAIVLISPHNPTGAVASVEELDTLAKVASRHRLAIILDEVFSPFLFGRSRLPRPAATEAPLVLTLNGLSKMLALPGLKIGWVGVTGDPELVKKTMQALDMISDTFLPVNEMAQFAVPALLKNSGPFEKSYVSEIHKRMGYAITLLRNKKKTSFAEPEGGFFLTLRLNKTRMDEEEIAFRLLQKHKILVHPGYFYDMEGRHLVMSFVNKPVVLHKTLNALLQEIS